MRKDQAAPERCKREEAEKERIEVNGTNENIDITTQSYIGTEMTEE
jgi:hypothetical protein